MVYGHSSSNLLKVFDSIHSTQNEGLLIPTGDFYRVLQIAETFKYGVLFYFENFPLVVNPLPCICADLINLQKTVNFVHFLSTAYHKHENEIPVFTDSFKSDCGVRAARVLWTVCCSTASLLYLRLKFCSFSEILYLTWTFRTL